MEVILLQDVENLGDQNDLVTIKPGYGRNYLIPQGFAAVANESAKKVAAEKRKQSERREDLIMSKLNEVVDALKGNTITVGAKVGTSGKIFGSVTTIQLADAIKKQLNVSIDRKKIILPNDIKELGSYTAEVDLHTDVKVEINLEVVAE